MAVKPIPDGYPRVSPYLAVDNAEEEIAFIKTVFGAKERVRMDGPPGKVGHCELEIGDSLVMLSDMNEDTPTKFGGTGVMITVYVEDVDAIYAKALDAGAKSVNEPADQFYGDRSAGFTDPAGHNWFIQTHIEDVTPEQMQERMAAMMGGAGG